MYKLRLILSCIINQLLAIDSIPVSLYKEWNTPNASLMAVPCIVYFGYNKLFLQSRYDVFVTIDVRCCSNYLKRVFASHHKVIYVVVP